MLCIHNLNGLIESLKAKGYKVEYKNKVWKIDGKFVDENEIPNLVNGMGKDNVAYEVVKDKKTGRFKKVKKDGK